LSVNLKRKEDDKMEKKKDYIVINITLKKDDYIYLQERILDLKKQGVRGSTISGYLRYLIQKDKEENKGR
jgi:LAS superfamily LD-carboxypeptidase LdcB